ncbi:methyltransferase domain-containing protein [Fimicolochytrium jonesii]|uniref:methyltransferase domain-containing protein n=1 Tax=Fimicolochytrium jonesii TaxID=1396493 RepID=UPI0022FF2000|nr:methyltransferase domain-containing protein [Fimicolochytrium jonesii]KAI8817631.1 methyltransferase domain-containing protein [Fimicolochytrium jonesii]
MHQLRKHSSSSKARLVMMAVRSFTTRKSTIIAALVLTMTGCALVSVPSRDMISSTREPAGGMIPFWASAPSSKADIVDRYTRCLTRPPSGAVMYNTERCWSDISTEIYMDVLARIEDSAPTELSRFQIAENQLYLPNWQPFDLFKPTYECNAMDLLRIGEPSRKSDSGKWLCSDKIEFGNKCVIFSVGSNNQFDFEVEMHGHFPKCEIHTFDCTGDFSNPSTTFHRTCVGREDVKTEKGAFKRLSTIKKELGVNTVSLLKMDIENFEWQFFLDMLDEPEDSRPMQILVEFHIRMELHDPTGKLMPYPWDLAPTLFEGWNRNWAIPIARMVKVFHQLGYRIVWQERNRWGEFATELILVHQRAL